MQKWGLHNVLETDTIHHFTRCPKQFGFADFVGASHCHSTTDLCGTFTGETRFGSLAHVWTCGAVVLRGRRYGDGPHTSLTKRHSSTGLILVKVGMVGALLSLVWWYDLGVAWDVVRTQSIGWLDLVIRPVGITFVTLLAIRLSKSHEQTAWNPHGISSAFIWILGLVFIVGSAIGIGRFEKLNPAFHSESLLLGFAFLTVGLIVGRAQHLRQRLAAGTKDNRRYKPALFNYLFSSLGSAFGLWALYFHSRAIGFGRSSDV